MKTNKSIRVTRRGLQLTLGCFWLLDGALQLQHQMFGNAFITQVISPATLGQPHFVTGIMHFWMTIFLQHPAVWNSAAAVTQLAIGALLLWKPTARLGLLGSMLWGMFVWYVGEGLGGLLGGQTSLLMGAPGAALLYAILALAAVPPDEEEKSRDEHQFPAAWLVFAWAIIWIGGAVYQLLPGQNITTGLAAMIAGNAHGAPGWLASVDMRIAHVISGFASSTAQGNGYWFILILAIVQLAVGVGIFAQKSTREFVLYAGIVISALFWIVGQRLGGYWTGLATDPNTSPLIVVLALAILGQPLIDHELPKIYKKFERFFI